MKYKPGTIYKERLAQASETVIQAIDVFQAGFLELLRVAPVLPG